MEDTRASFVTLWPAHPPELPELTLSPGVDIERLEAGAQAPSHLGRFLGGGFRDVREMRRRLRLGLRVHGRAERRLDVLVRPFDALVERILRTATADIGPPDSELHANSQRTFWWSTEVASSRGRFSPEMMYT
jgi:hypothetical protein